MTISDMRVMVTTEEIKSALRELGPIGELGEAFVKVATEAYLHLQAGGSVNGQRLAPVSAVQVGEPG